MKVQHRQFGPHLINHRHISSLDFLHLGCCQVICIFAFSFSFNVLLVELIPLFCLHAQQLAVKIIFPFKVMATWWRVEPYDFIAIGCFSLWPLATVLLILGVLLVFWCFDVKPIFGDDFINCARVYGLVELLLAVVSQSLLAYHLRSPGPVIFGELRFHRCLGPGQMLCVLQES